MNDDITSTNPVAALRVGLGLTYEEFGKKIGCSKGHTYELTTGKRSVTRRIADALERLSGRPWHEWMPPAAKKDAA